MDNSEQVNVIKQALDLEKEVERLKMEYDTLMNDKFKAPPKEPIFTKVDRVFPEPESKMKYVKFAVIFVVAAIVGGVLAVSLAPGSIISRILGILASLSIVIAIAGYFLIFKKMKAKDVEKIKNSDEFQAEIKRLESEYDEKDARAYAEYKQCKKEYDEILMPQWKSDKAKWESEIDSKRASALEELNNAKAAIENLYTTSKVIPGPYHNIYSLDYLYNLMSTSDYDIKEAIKHFEENEERLKAEEHRRRQTEAAEHRAVMEEERAAAAWQQAEAAMEQVEIAKADLARKAIQEHNRNKYLKKLANKNR